MKIYGMKAWKYILKTLAEGILFIASGYSFYQVMLGHSLSGEVNIPLLIFSISCAVVLFISVTVEILKREEI